MLHHTPWGKLQRDEDGVPTARLGLAEHSMDVAATFEALLALPTVAARLQTLTRTPLDATVGSRLAVFAFLHDIGKTSVGFQSKALPEQEARTLLRRRGIELHERGHTRIVGGLLCKSSFRAVFPVEEIVAWGSAHLDLWLAAISHHGDPIRERDLHRRGPQSLWEPADGYSPMEAVRMLAERARTWFPDAWTNGEALPNEPDFIHAFAGFVSLADWIASNDAPGFFPYADHGAGERADFARSRATEVLRRMRIDVEDARADLRRRAPDFGDVFRTAAGTPFDPSLLQTGMADRSLGQIVVAEAETGSGKTEAALWRFKTLFEAGEVDSLAFVLPTRVAAVSLEGRVRRFFERLFPDARLRPNVVLAVPGYISADGEIGQRDALDALARFETLWPDSDDESAAHRRWAAEHAKRYLAAAAAVGTVDQALLTGLTTRHAHLRGAALLRALIVVDEVHASDAYMTQLLTGVLRRHAKAGGHALLLSATLGSDARAHLLDQRPPRLRPGETRPTPDGPDPASAPYPALTDATRMRNLQGSGREKCVEVSLAPTLADPEATAATAAEASEQGVRVLVVRNTVDGAVAVQRALEARLGPDHPALFRIAGRTRPRHVVAPHHGRFAAPDRRLLDHAVDRVFGRDAPRGGGVVLVGTQTLEQSLDIDADLLLTDLAPADVLLQRFGRLHRHPETVRPTGFETARAIVATPAERDLAPFLERRAGRPRHGLGAVYENLLSVEATWRALETKVRLSLPHDNRVLVEDATRRDVLAALADTLGGDWPEHWREYEGRSGAKRGAAEIAKLDWSCPWDDQNWAEPGERLRTRLGLEDRIAPLPGPWTSPFGERLTQMRIPGWMAPDGRDDPETPANLLAADADTLAFDWNGAHYRYSRLGLVRDRGES